MKFALFACLATYLWSIVQFMRFKRNMGLSDDQDKNIVAFYAGMKTALLLVIIYLYDFPNIVWNIGVDRSFYLYIFVYEVTIEEPILIRAQIYNSVVNGLHTSNSLYNILLNIKSHYGISIAAEIVES